MRGLILAALVAATLLCGTAFASGYEHSYLSLTASGLSGDTTDESIVCRRLVATDSDLSGTGLSLGAYISAGHRFGLLGTVGTWSGEEKFRAQRLKNTDVTSWSLGIRFYID